MSVYYNEFDPFAAVWLRELMKEGLIPEGDVDERSITEVDAWELAGYAQCHFFAGIGGWAYALRLAGWPDDRPVWTGSCPCQPFSAAGKRRGVADERHLWPVFERLIAQRRPPVVFGEQVASKDGVLWLAGVRADLEACGYAVGAADLPAAGVGAPHIRQRLWWLADADGRLAGHGHLQPGGQHGQQSQDGGAGDRRLAHADSEGQSELSVDGEVAGRGGECFGGLEHPTRDGREQRRAEPGWRGAVGGRGEGGLGDAHDARSQRRIVGGDSASERLARPAGVGFWSRAEWLACSDGKARRVEPGIFPLAYGVPNRVGTLRGAGNAIVPQVAAEFVRAYLDVRG